jgi:hypothetical protein
MRGEGRKEMGGKGRGREAREEKGKGGREGKGREGKGGRGQGEVNPHQKIRDPPLYRAYMFRLLPWRLFRKRSP